MDGAQEGANDHRGVERATDTVLKPVKRWMVDSNHLRSVLLRCIVTWCEYHAAFGESR